MRGASYRPLPLLPPVPLLRRAGPLGLACLLAVALAMQVVAPHFRPALRRTPSPRGQWVASGLSMQVNALLAVPPPDAGLLYAGTTDGVWLSTDAGRTWRRAGSGLDGLGVYALAATRGGAPILAGGDDGVVYARAERRVAGSARWRPISPRLGGNPVFSIAVSPGDGRTVLAGTVGALYRGIAAGAGWRWQQVARTQDASITAIAWAPWDTRLAFASVFGVWPPVLVTHDGGRRWWPDTAGLPAALPVQALLAVGGRTPGLVLSTMGDGVWRRSISGAWHDVSAGLPRRHAMPLVAAPGSPTPLYAGTMGDGVYVLRGEGPWRRLGQGRNSAGYIDLSLAATAGPHRALLAGTDRGVLRYTLPP